MTNVHQINICMRVMIGCCGYPVSKSKYYSEFKVIEIQSTFYNIPRDSTIIRWREEAPSGFEYIVKAFQGITHPITSPTWRRYRGELPGNSSNYGLLKNTDEVYWAWEKTLNICRLLNSNKVLIQLPPRCEATHEALTTLEKFVDEKLEIILEPRHASWFKNDIIGFLRDREIILCVDPFKNKPIRTGDLHYWRLHGRNGYKYGYKYTDDDLRELIGFLENISDVHAVYILFNNKYMYEDALRLRAILRETGFETI